ncbi:MAG: hypothetical protein KAI66_16405 [Lentisphaeria bacterium]|nr:hypothetical protein [Lentisphaeria bacterium]
MSGSTQRLWAIGAALVVLLGTAQLTWSQDAVEVRLAPSGMLQVSRGGAELASIEINAHGANWTHAPQKGAKAEVGDLPEQAGKCFTGILPIPNTEGGSIRYTETVRTLSQGFRLEYELTMTKAMKLNGLQLSINIPVAKYAGKEVVVSQVQDDEPKLVGLPKEQPEEGRFQLWSGQGAKIELAKGTPEAITLELRAETDVIIQDLRQWEQPVFEIRFPAIMEASGHAVAAGDRYHLDITITFAGPACLKGP